MISAKQARENLEESLAKECIQKVTRELNFLDTLQLKYLDKKIKRASKNGKERIFYSALIRKNVMSVLDEKEFIVTVFPESHCCVIRW